MPDKDDLLGRALSGFVLVFVLLVLTASVMRESYLRHAEQNNHQQGTGERQNSPKGIVPPAPQLKTGNAADESQQQRNWAEKAWQHWVRRFFVEIRVTDALVALFTGLLVLVGYVQAKRMRQTIRTMDDTAQRQLRAYVSLGTTTSVIADNKCRCETILKNNGQTPAYSVCDSMEAWVGTFPKPAAVPVLAFGEGDKPTCLAPSGEITLWDDIDVSDEELAAIRARDKAIWMAAKVTYRDTFGNEWTTAILDYVTGARVDEEDHRMTIEDYQAT